MNIKIHVSKLIKPCKDYLHKHGSQLIINEHFKNVIKIKNILFYCDYALKEYGMESDFCFVEIDDNEFRMLFDTQGK